MTNPNTNPNGTDSVSQEQAFKDWTAAGNGVPLQYKGREHVWDRKVDNMKKGGEVHMGAGGLLGKVMKGAQKILPATERDANLAKFLKGNTSEVPKIVKHATRADFPAFDIEKSSPSNRLGPGFYTANDMGTTSSYSSGEGGNIMPLHISLKNPIVGSELTPEQIRNFYSQIKTKKFSNGFDATEAHKDIMERALENPTRAFSTLLSGAHYFDTNDWINGMKATGHDGIIGNRNGKPEYVVFDNKQLKSATGNRGTYDINEADINKAVGGAIHTDEGGAATGVFPQMKPRRAKQDREAAKNVPVDLARGFASGVLGAPGDIESLIRMPYDYLRAPTMSELVTGDKTSKTFLPTAEEIEKRLPFRSESPVSKAAAGLGSLAGGFYTGPGAPIRVVGALPGALKHGAQEFAKASVAGVPHVIKPKGGNWLTGSVEKSLSPLKQRMARAAEENFDPRQGMTFGEISSMEALNNWIDRNLTNYVKKEMATPEDPVRKLAEQGIVHIPSEQVGVNRYRAPKHREAYGGEQLGKSEAARAWEDASDVAINAPTAQGIKTNESLYQANPWIEKLANEDRVYALNTPASQAQEISGLGFDHIMDVLREDLTAGRIRPEQLNKVSISDAVRRTHEFDQEAARKMAEAQIKNTEGMPVHKEYPEGYKWIELNMSPEQKAAAKEYQDKFALELGKRVSAHPGDKNGMIPTQAIKKQLQEEFGPNPIHKLEDALKYEGDTMGHCVGGYCPDVLEGRSRIYSLRSAKGEPHVTIEVQPPRQPGWAEARQAGGDPLAIQNEAKRRMGLDPDSVDDNREIVKNWDGDTRHAKQQEMNKHFADIYREQFGEPPQRIVQIKGKQNAAPKADYLPYVQDFVKGGKWSDVGDLRNTGLTRKSDLIDKFSPDELDAIGAGEYLTKAEQDELLLRALRPPEEPHMAGGGLLKAGIRALMEEAPRGVEPIVVKAAERAAAGKKAAELIKSQPQVKASEALGQAMEKGFKKTTTTQADRTRVGGGNIGGAAFPAISEVHPEYAGKVWGVMDEGTASRLKNLTDPETAWTTMLGSEHQLKTNPIVFDKLKRGFMDSMKAGNLSPELEAKINHNLALKFGKGADIRDPSIWKQADTFDKRAALADLMMGQGIPPGKGGVALGGEKSGKGVIFKPTDILKQETERGLLHPEHGGEVDTFAAGPRLFSMEPESMYRPDLHPGFPTLISGKDLGVNMMPTPTEVYLPDWHRKFKADNPNRKAPGYYDLALGVKGQGLPSQEINDEFIRHLLREGFKAGGAVGGLSAATKSCNCHD